MTETPGADRKSAVPERGPSEGAQRRPIPWALILAGVLGGCALLLTAWFVSSERETGRALEGVRVGELDVSGLDREQIEARLRAWAEQRGARSTTLTLAASKLSFEPKTVGFVVAAEASAARALAVGRSAGFCTRFAAFLARRFRPDVVSIEISFEPALLSRVFDGWEQSSIKDPPFVGGISVSGTSINAVYPRSGTRIDRARATEQLRSAVVNGVDGQALSTRVEAPGVERAEVDRVVALAQAMLARDTELVSSDGSRRLPLSALQVASLLRVQVDASHTKLELECAPEALRGLLDAERPTLEQQPENARFVIDAQDHVHVEPGHSGVLLDDSAVARAVCRAAQSATKKGDLPLDAGAEPALSTEAAELAGVVGLVGTYTTRYACCQPRVQNIHHIADLLDGTLVRPGETFSVNQSIGPRTIKNGFRPAPSIEDGDMVDTVGGGVSQFATTLFNALFYGGYDILERQPHSYWFTRYPMGYDATLSYPHPDIVFKNDTAAGALIKTQYTDTTITVKIYGDNGGRRVRAEVSPRQNIVLPPVEFIPNRELDADEEKPREGGEIGWTVIVKRTITYPDGKLKEERRKVTYKPRARRVEVHPCRIPEGEPGHTGERCPKPDKDAPSDAADAGAK
jgi:vancomycin resistance protein YoaR